MSVGGPFEARRGRFRFDAAEVPPAFRLAEIGQSRRFDLDLDVIADRLVLGSPPAGATVLRGVRATYTRPFPLERLDEATPARTPLEAARRLRHGLERAVAHALQGATRAAVLTGGGVDSSALLALAHAWAREHGATIFAVALDFGGQGDDRPHLAALERHLSCEVVRVRPEDGAKRIDLLHRGVDAAPFTWPGGFMEVEALARAKANGAEVVLTGVGADEIFDGDPRALARIAMQSPLRGIRAARSMRGFDRPSWPVVEWVIRPLLARVQPPMVRAWRHRRRRPELPAWAGPRLADRLESRERAPDQEPDATPWEHPYHEHLAWLRHQEDVAAGITCHPPFLERSLRALVRSFEPSWLLHAEIRRGLFREAVRDLLPASLVGRTDKARFELGLQRFLVAAGGFEMLRPLVSVRELSAAGLVVARRFQDAFAAFERAPDDGEQWANCWAVLAVEAFLRHRGAA